MVGDLNNAMVMQISDFFFNYKEVVIFYIEKEGVLEKGNIRKKMYREALIQEKVGFDIKRM